MSSLTIRRAIVFAGAVLALYAGAFAIRAAAGWSGESQPLAQPPDAAALVAQLLDEQARAEQLAAQLEQATAHSRELTDALAAVTDKAAQDTQSARRLARQLDAARDKLLELQRQLASRPAPPAATVTLAAPPTPAPPPPGEPDDDEHEDD
jgi:uncharacterized protein with von Willebrand factor type A (vWA) domain